MPLTPGTRLGPYEILEPIGAGGMGFDVAPDGRLIVVQDDVDRLPTDIQVILNWQEDLKRLVPTE